MGASVSQQAAPASHQQPAPSAELASHAVHSGGQPSGNNDSQSSAAGLDSSRSTSRAASQSAGISPATSSTNSPDHRLPSTPPSSTAHSQHSLAAASGPIEASTSQSAARHAVKQEPLQRQHQPRDTSDPQIQQQHALATSSQAQPLADAAQQADAGSASMVSQHPTLAQGQLPAASMNAVQHDPVVQLVSRRASGRVAPPGFSGPVAAPVATAGSQPNTARQKVDTVMQCRDLQCISLAW